MCLRRFNIKLCATTSSSLSLSSSEFLNSLISASSSNNNDSNNSNNNNQEEENKCRISFFLSSSTTNPRENNNTFVNNNNQREKSEETETTEEQEEQYHHSFLFQQQTNNLFSSSSDPFQKFLATSIPPPYFLMRLAVFRHKICSSEQKNEENVDEKFSYFRQACIEIEFYKKKSQFGALRITEHQLGMEMLKVLLLNTNNNKNAITMIMMDPEEVKLWILSPASLLEKTDVRKNIRVENILRDFEERISMISSSTTTMEEINNNDNSNNESLLSIVVETAENLLEVFSPVVVEQQKKGEVKERMMMTKSEESSSNNYNATTPVSEVEIMNEISSIVDSFFTNNKNNSNNSSLQQEKDEDEEQFSKTLPRSLLQQAASISTQVTPNDLVDIFAAYAVFASELISSESSSSAQNNNNNSSSSSSVSIFVLPFEFQSELKSIAYVINARIESGLISEIRQLERCALSAAFLGMMMVKNNSFWGNVLKQFREEMLRKKLKFQNQHQKSNKKLEEKDDDDVDNASLSYFEKAKKDNIEEEEEKGEGEEQQQKNKLEVEEEDLEMIKKSSLGVLFAMKRRQQQLEDKIVALDNVGKRTSVSLLKSKKHSEHCFHECEKILEQFFF